MKSLPDSLPPIQFPFETNAPASDWPPARSWVDRPIPFRLTDLDNGDGDDPDNLPTEEDRDWWSAQDDSGGWVENEPDPTDLIYGTESAFDHFARLAGESEEDR